MENKKLRTVIWAAGPAFFVMLLAAYPQAALWISKGTAFTGAYFVSNYDETAYSAYVNSLMNGRPRVNDPQTGNDSPAGESLYSVQFVPAYASAAIFKMFGLSTGSGFALLNFLLPIFSALAIFLLVKDLSGDDRLAGSAVVFALCAGTAIAYQGELRQWLTGGVLIDFFPYLRRYQPGLGFPIFFLFCAAIWRSFAAERWNRIVLWATVAGFLLVILMFTYFYLWTAAAAWLAIFALASAIFGPLSTKSAARSLIPLAILGLGSIKYFAMLAQRDTHMDDVQLLHLTRMPDIAAVPVILGLVAAAAVLVVYLKGKAEISKPLAAFTISFGITPLLLLNQQVITGRSLQPVHYEIFIANYMAGIALVLAVWLIFRVGGAYEKLVVYMAIAAAIWGVIETSGTAAKYTPIEGLREQAIPAFAYLNSQPIQKDAAGRYPAVFASSMMVADYVPTATGFRSLWNPHINSAGGLSQAENKELFLAHIYFGGVSEEEFERALTQGLYEFRAAVFGGGRALAALKSGADPITPAEIKKETAGYTQFKERIASGAIPQLPSIEYAMVPIEAEPNWSNLDKLYERSEPRDLGIFRIYRLRPLK